MNEQPTAKNRRQTPVVTRMLYGLITGLLIGISALALSILYERLNGPAEVNTGHFKVAGVADFDGTISIDPPVDMLDFTLVNQFGEPTRLADLRERFVLLSFGFTHCPDICPLTLNDFRRLQELLGELAADLHFVFISVDGERDTPDTLRDYFAFRQLEGIIGLTGEEKAIRDLGAPLGLSFEVSADSASGGYQVNHTAGSFLLDPLGRWITRYQFGVPPSTIAADLRLLLSA